MTNDYYTSKLSAYKLKQCYDVAPARVKRYLDAEIEHVLDCMGPNDDVLELGCGYGRVLERLVQVARNVIGIDTSRESLALAQDSLGATPNCHLIQMNAATLGMDSSSIDKTICIQNGISSFKIKPEKLVIESVRVTKDKGICIFSSYSDRFWNDRLDWFKIQSERGLIGEIDWKKTGDGVIVCKNGFKATTFSKDDFTSLATSLSLEYHITEVDQSSVFCTILVEK